jgi:hypothetical protein
VGREATEEEGGAAAAAANDRRPLARARERLAEATLPVPFALLPPSARSSSSSFSPPPLPGAREVSPRERRRLRARAPLPSFPDFAGFFRKKHSLSERKQAVGSKRDRGGEEEKMEVDEKEVEEEAPAAAAKEEEENSGDDGDDGYDDRERLTEALEWLGLAASLSAPSVTLAESSEESAKGNGEKGTNSVDVCSFEGLLGSGFAEEALGAAAAAVSSAKDGGGLPWAALVIVGFPDSPLSWTRKATAAAANGEGGKAAAAKKKEKKRKTSSAPSAPEPVRLGPEACREHALFVVVVKGGGGGGGGGEGGGGCRFLAAVASGGGDGFASGLL